MKLLIFLLAGMPFIGQAQNLFQSNSPTQPQVMTNGYGSTKPYKPDPKCPSSLAAKGKDLRKWMGPIRDQDTLGWCYAHGVADQMNYYMFRHHIAGIGIDRDNRVSASAAAILHGNGTRSIFFGQYMDRINEAAKSSAEAASIVAKLSGMQEKGEAISNKLLASDPDLKILKAKMDAAEQQSLLASQALRDNKDPVKQTTLGAAYERVLTQYTSLHAQIGFKINQQPEMAALRREAGILIGRVKNLVAPMALPQPSLEADGGAPLEVMRAMIDTGVCTEKQLPSDDLSHQALNSLISEAQTDQAQTPTPAQNIFETYLNPFYQSPTQANQCWAANGLHNLFPGLSVAQIGEVLGHYKEIDPIANLLTDACHPPIRFSDTNKPEVQDPIFDPSKIVSSIDANLKSEVPTGITVAGENLQSAGFFNPSAPADHYVLVVGSRKNCATGEQEYIIRNSWGREACETAVLKTYHFAGGMNYGPFGTPWAAPVNPVTDMLDKKLAQCIAGCGAKFAISQGGLSESEANLLSDCNDTCRDMNAKEFESATHIVPSFSCDNGDFVVSRNTLGAMAKGAYAIK